MQQRYTATTSSIPSSVAVVTAISMASDRDGPPTDMEITDGRRTGCVT